MTAISVPVVAPNVVPVLNGFEITITDTDAISVSAGIATDSGSRNYITSATALTIDTAISGAGGLDTGTIAASTLYAVLVTGDSVNQNDGIVKAMLTLQSTEATPTLPSPVVGGIQIGYDQFRVVGYVLTDGSANLLSGVWFGKGADREFQFATSLAVLAGGTSTSFATVDIDNAVPRQIIPDGAEVGLNYAFTANADSDTFAFLTYGVTSTDGMQIFTGPEASAVAQAITWIPTGLNSGVPAIQYKVSAGSLAASVFGYRVSL